MLFPMLIGLFAFTCNANRELVALLCRLGWSVGYTTTLANLHVLAADSELRLKLLGAFTDALGPQFLFLFDNSGTAATVIELEDVPPGALLSEPFAQKIADKARSKLTVKQLSDDIDWPHVRGTISDRETGQTRLPAT
ncbi:hypothetical protein R3P38DRAFT_3496454 [Favolaschia claudopus]|uniref:Uncharacterized protein n=1 Tax=Favolaschia claudopus TaxID=2862362 RepID=A0AAW0C3A7_9AGAR